MSRLAPLALLLLLLAGLVGLELAGGGPQAAAVEGAAPLQSPVQAAPGQAVDLALGAVQAILARPLFAPNRRPPSAGAAAPGPPPPPLPRVAGILLHGRERSVIFAAAGDLRPVVVGEGGTVNGFRVEAIEDGAVTVVGPDGPRVLHPSFDPSPPTVAPRPALPGVLPGLGAGLPARLPGVPGLPGAIPGLPVLGEGPAEIAR